MALGLRDRAILELTGEDTLALLERTVTHSVSDWAEGTWRYGGLLTPQGKLIIDYLALRTPEGVHIDVHADGAADLEKRLKLFRLRARVDIALAPHLASATHPSGAPDPRSAMMPPRAIVPSTDITGSLENLDAHRIAAGIPEWGADYGASDVFPSDVNMDQLSGVDYRKGCFIGQEVASRMKRKGGMRKRTVKLVCEALSPGDDVRAPESLGTVTSASGQMGLARLRIDRLARALAEGRSIAINDAPARPELPAWLEAEIEAHQADGNEPVER